MLANRLSTDWNFALVGVEAAVPAVLDDAVPGAGADGAALGYCAAFDAAVRCGAAP